MFLLDFALFSHSHILCLGLPIPLPYPLHFLMHQISAPDKLQLN